MTSLFKNEQAKHTIRDWSERFRAKLTVPTESRTVALAHGGCPSAPAQSTGSCRPTPIPRRSNRFTN